MQPSLFPMPAAPALPPGYLYCPEKITPEDERRLLNRIADLPFKEFQFHGFESKRKGRVIRLALRFQRAKGGQRDRLCKQRVGPGSRSQISERCRNISEDSTGGMLCSHSRRAAPRRR